MNCSFCGKPVSKYLFLCDECADTIIMEEIRKAMIFGAYCSDCPSQKKEGGLKE